LDSNLKFPFSKIGNRFLDYPIYTPVTLWQDFDCSSPLNVTEIKEYTENGIVYKEVYFSGRNIEGRSPRIYGVTAKKEGQENLPFIFIINDFSLSVDKSFLNYFAKAGFCAFMVDIGGENNNKDLKYTIYPESVSYANYKNRQKVGEVLKSVKETCWYEWTATTRYGISYLKSLDENALIGVIGIRSGGNIAWMLAAIDDRIAASCSLFAAGWKINLSADLTADAQKWLAGVSTETYALKVKKPIMFLSASNDAFCHMDKAYDTLNRVPADIPLIFSFSSRLKGIMGHRNSKDILLFFNKFLKNKDINLPKIPKLTSNVSDGKLILKLAADTSEEIEDVHIYYAEGESNPEIRNWKNLKIEKTFEGVFQGECDFFSAKAFLYSFSKVSYKNGFTVSSNMLSLNLESLNLSAVNKRKSQIIYNSQMGKDTFTCYSFNEDAVNASMFLETPNVRVVLGPMDIYGITASYKALASYKISDPFYRGDKEKIFKFDVYSKEAQELKVCFIENIQGVEEIYSATVSLVGGPIWQPVEIRTIDLKTTGGITLKDWQKVSMFAFESSVSGVFNNILWL